MFIPIDPSDNNEAMYLLSFFDNFIILNFLYALIVILFVGLSVLVICLSRDLALQISKVNMKLSKSLLSV